MVTLRVHPAAGRARVNQMKAEIDCGFPQWKGHAPGIQESSLPWLSVMVMPVSTG